MDNTIVFDQVICPLDVVLGILDHHHHQDGKRLPVFQDIASVVTPEAVHDDLHDPQDYFAEETFSMVSALSFDQSFIYDGENNDDSSVDQLLDNLGEDDYADENEAKEESSEWSFDLSCLIDKEDDAKSIVPSRSSEGQGAQEVEIGRSHGPAADDSRCAMDLGDYDDDATRAALHAAVDFFFVAEVPSSSLLPHLEACHTKTPPTHHPVTFPGIADVSREFLACLNEQQCIRQSVR